VLTVADINIPRGPIDTPPHHAIVTEHTERLDDATRQALLEALDGLQLGAYDWRIVDWLSGWEPSTVATICAWLYRARVQRSEGA
jgi:hypothetical protein